MLHLIASTGRTATSFFAECFDRLPGIAACHEGHRRNDDGAALIPLINLENAQVFKDPATGARVVAAKRSAEIIGAALGESGCEVIVDSAYYNAVIGTAILEAHASTRMVALVRDCEGFVRSVTWLEGTDPMPVGWPDPGKPLDNRERFISMGRIRPADHLAEEWPSWGAIERNIWLWRATNQRLLDCKRRWPDRVEVLDFGLVRSIGIVELGRRVLAALQLDTPDRLAVLDTAAEAGAGRANQRSGGYQIGPAETWTGAQRNMLRSAQRDIDERIGTWT